MISWRKYSDLEWEFKYKEKHYIFKSLAEVIAASVIVEVPEEEIKEAIMQLEEREHNYAEFGFNRRFTFSEKV